MYGGECYLIVQLYVKHKHKSDRLMLVDVIILILV